MISGIGFSELLLILAIALIIFGPAKLPEIGRSLGKTIREFRDSSRAIRDDFMTAGHEVQERIEEAQKGFYDQKQ